MTCPTLTGTPCPLSQRLAAAEAREKRLKEVLLVIVNLSGSFLHTSDEAKGIKSTVLDWLPSWEADLARAALQEAQGDA